MQNVALLALGSNLHGPWGTSTETLRCAIGAVQLAGCRVYAESGFYKSGSLLGSQPDYTNLVVAVDAPMAASSLLRLAKSLERQAGRKVRAKWSARPLDIDIIMVGTMCYNWPHREVGRLTLPHPEVHRRVFVLRPLCDVAPDWYHPGLQATARQLLQRLPEPSRRSIRAIQTLANS